MMTINCRLVCTPSQTIGPFLQIGLSWPDGPFVVPADNPGGFWIVGQLFDGEGEPIRDGLIETWQCDPEGRFDHPDDPRGASRSAVDGFRGFGRAETDRDGRYRIYTVKPGPLPAENGAIEAPHLDVSVFARGLLNRVVTRLYFPDEGEANAGDPVLRSVADELRRRLIASPGPEGLCFDIHLQGEHESVFFEL